MKRLIIGAIIGLITGAVVVMLLLVPVSRVWVTAPPPSMPAPMLLGLGVPPLLAPPPEIVGVDASLAPMPPAETWAEMVRKGVILLSTAEERMIVRTGQMSLIVEDVVETRDEIADLAVRFDGYVISSRISGEGRWGEITIRVPDDKFEQALAKLRDLAVRVTSESTSSRDVTEEYVDLESRLKNAEATESQYLALLEKAEDVEDIVSIYDSLFRVRGEIEQIKGRMLYLERIVEMSLISVQLSPEFPALPLVRPGWSAVETLESAVRGIVIFGQWLGTTAIWLVIFSPVWGAIIGIIYYWRRRRRKA